MPRPPDPLPDELGAVFTWSEARQAGVGSRRLLHDDVERVIVGVYRRRDLTPRPPKDLHAAAQETWAHRTRAESVAPHLPGGLFFVGRTAASLWHLPVTLHDHDPLEVAAFAPKRAPTRRGLAARTVRPHLARAVRRAGVPVTDPATTWAMLAPELTFADGVALGDAVILRPRVPGTQRVKRLPLATPEELAAVVELGRRPGNDRLRALLPMLVTQSASPPESHLRLRLREWGAPEPTLDHDVYDRDGLLIGCSEIAYPALRLALEYEGSHHRLDRRQWNRDIEKYRRYAELGWEVLRVTAELLYRRRDELRRQVFEALARRSQ